MILLLTVTLPVFLVLGFGYLAAWRGWIGEAAIDGLMKFAQGFAIPCLLFLAITRLDLSQEFNLPLLGSFYAGALAGFFAGLFGARLIFGRVWEDAVAIGFVGLFSNSLLLGLPITERAYGADALQANFAIIAVHSPFCYGIGITAMEVVRARGQSGALGFSPRLLDNRHDHENAEEIPVLVFALGKLGIVGNGSSPIRKRCHRLRTSAPAGRA